MTSAATSAAATPAQWGHDTPARRELPMLDHLIIRVSDPEGNNIEAVLHDYEG